MRFLLMVGNHVGLIYLVTTFSMFSHFFTTLSLLVYKQDYKTPGTGYIQQTKHPLSAGAGGGGYVAQEEV